MQETEAETARLSPHWVVQAHQDGGSSATEVPHRAGLTAHPAQDCQPHKQGRHGGTGQWCGSHWA